MLPQLFLFFATVVVAAPIPVDSLDKLTLKERFQKTGHYWETPAESRGLTFEELTGYPDPHPEQAATPTYYPTIGKESVLNEKQKEVAYRSGFTRNAELKHPQMRASDTNIATLPDNANAIFEHKWFAYLPDQKKAEGAYQAGAPKI